MCFRGYYKLIVLSSITIKLLIHELMCSVMSQDSINIKYNINAISVTVKHFLPIEKYKQAYANFWGKKRCQKLLYPSLH